VSAEPPVGTSNVLGRPRLHMRCTDSTNERARKLAIAGAPHGTLVTAAEQTSGRGRQGRAWVAPAGCSLLCSLVLRRPPALLSLAAAVGVCDAVGEPALVKWPNDVVIERVSTDAGEATLAKLAGILVEGRPQEDWAVLGIGVNVAVRVQELPTDVRERAASLELAQSAIEPLLAELLEALTRRLAEPREKVLDAWRERDALLGREVTWSGGVGLAAGIDRAGRLLVRKDDSTELTALEAGEVHLGSHPQR
jgi:BirA family biotin operon repressor/biotin-[acetyl-CoA-carboxylase] ligase